MAQIVGIFENLSGKIGEVVFVRKNGKTFVKRRPSKSKTPPSPRMLAQRASFGLSGKIASKICQVDELKQLWPEIKYNNQTSSSRIFKSNCNRLNIENLTGTIELTPEFGFYLEEASITICERGLLIECYPIGTNVDYGENTKQIMAAGVIVLKKTTESNLPDYDILPYKSKKILFDVKAPINIEVSFEGGELYKFCSYPIKKAFGALITMDENGRPIKYSKTFDSK